MKKTFHNIILLGFVLFCGGGILKVLLQAFGLIFLNDFLVDFARHYFNWIYPMAAVTGLLCYISGYFKEKS